MNAIKILRESAKSAYRVGAPAGYTRNYSDALLDAAEYAETMGADKALRRFETIAEESEAGYPGYAQGAAFAAQVLNEVG